MKKVSDKTTIRNLRAALAEFAISCDRDAVRWCTIIRDYETRLASALTLNIEAAAMLRSTVSKPCPPKCPMCVEKRDLIARLEKGITP